MHVGCKKLFMLFMHLDVPLQTGSMLSCSAKFNILSSSLSAGSKLSCPTKIWSLKLQASYKHSCLI